MASSKSSHTQHIASYRMFKVKRNSICVALDVLDLKQCELSIVRRNGIYDDSQTVSAYRVNVELHDSVNMDPKPVLFNAIQRNSMQFSFQVSLLLPANTQNRYKREMHYQ